MNLLRKNSKDESGRGLLIFEQVSDVFRAEKLLKSEGYEVTAVAPPMKYRRGCDLGLQFELALSTGIERTLKSYSIPYIDLIAMDEDGREPVKVVQSVDFGDFIMVKSGNMKLSFHKESGEIVNISGGGCPDVPYLHVSLIGRKLEDAPPPKELGYTLCALMLQRAYEEALSLKGAKKCILS